MGYSGACRREELTNMCVDDIEYKDDVIIVRIPKTKIYVKRTFAITNNVWINLIKKYVDLRPKKTSHRRFFLTFRNGYCLSSPIGINTMGKIAYTIAKYLNLPNPELYTGNCFKRSSAVNLSNKSASLMPIKKHGG